jgi:hypothetical protein
VSNRCLVHVAVMHLQLQGLRAWKAHCKPSWLIDLHLTNFNWMPFS